MGKTREGNNIGRVYDARATAFYFWEFLVFLSRFHASLHPLPAGSGYAGTAAHIAPHHLRHSCSCSLIMTAENVIAVHTAQHPPPSTTRTRWRARLRARDAKQSGSPDM